jgi:hypothetical protein
MLFQPEWEKRRICPWYVIYQIFFGSDLLQVIFSDQIAKMQYYVVLDDEKNVNARTHATKTQLVGHIPIYNNSSDSERHNLGRYKLDIVI